MKSRLLSLGEERDRSWFCSPDQGCLSTWFLGTNGEDTQADDLIEMAAEVLGEPTKITDALEDGGLRLKHGWEQQLVRQASRPPFVATVACD